MAEAQHVGNGTPQTLKIPFDRLTPNFLHFRTFQQWSDRLGDTDKILQQNPERLLVIDVQILSICDVRPAHRALHRHAQRVTKCDQLRAHREPQCLGNVSLTRSL